MNKHRQAAEAITETIDAWAQTSRGSGAPPPASQNYKTKLFRVKRALAELRQEVERTRATTQSRRGELISARTNFGEPTRANQLQNVLGYRQFNHAGYPVITPTRTQNGETQTSETQTGATQRRTKRPTNIKGFVNSVSQNLNSNTLRGSAEANALEYYYRFIKDKKNTSMINAYYRSILAPKSNAIQKFMNGRLKKSASASELNILKLLGSKKEESRGTGTGGGVVVAPVIGGPAPAPAPAAAPIIIQPGAPQIKINVPPAQTQFATQALPPMERTALMNAGGYGRATNAIMNAGGPGMIDRGVRALQSSGGNVRRASMNSGIPMRVFENINKLGGPVSARRTVVAVKKVSKKVKGGKKMKVKPVTVSPKMKMTGTKPSPKMKMTVTKPSKKMVLKSTQSIKKSTKKAKRPATKKKQVLSTRQKVKVLVQQIPRSELEKDVLACVFPSRR